MSDIFREVDEEIRREHFAALWQRYGTYLMVFVAVIALGTLAISSWNTYRDSQRAQQSDQFIAAMALLEQQDRPEEAVRAFDALAQQAGGGYGVLARFQKAAAWQIAGDWEQAVNVYDDIANDGGADALLRDLARIKAAHILVDKTSLDDLTARLSNVLNESNPLRLLAKDAIAFALFNAGDIEAARNEYELLSFNPLTPPNMRFRANQMLAVLGPGSNRVPVDSFSTPPPAEAQDGGNAVSGSETASEAEPESVTGNTEQ